LHSNVDQFFRIEQGEAKFVFNGRVERPFHEGDMVVVPAGTYHNVVNTSKTAMLKLLRSILRRTTRTGQCTRPKARHTL
jgi:mannose-6-phosphate isomerase-like protein (cupin superfamily)